MERAVKMTAHAAGMAALEKLFSIFIRGFRLNEHVLIRNDFGLPLGRLPVVSTDKNAFAPASSEFIRRTGLATESTTTVLACSTLSNRSVNMLSTRSVWRCTRSENLASHELELDALRFHDMRNLSHVGCHRLDFRRDLVQSLAGLFEDRHCCRAQFLDIRLHRLD